MRILVADTRALARHGLRLILEAQFPGADVGEAGTTARLLDRVREGPWDALLVDAGLAGHDCPCALEALFQASPGLRVLLLNVDAREPWFARILKAGAAAWLARESAGDELATAIRFVTEGGRYLSPLLARSEEAEPTAQREHARHEQLSGREYWVLRLIASGRTVGQIARELSLSVSTVSTYRCRVLRKLELENNAQLTVYAIREGLVG